MLHLGSPEETHRPFTSEVNAPFRLLFEDSWGVGWGFFVLLCLFVWGVYFLLVGLFGLFFSPPSSSLCACVLNLCMRVCMGTRASD